MDLDELGQLDQEFRIAIEMVNLGRLALGESGHCLEVRPTGYGCEPTFVFAILAE